MTRLLGLCGVLLATGAAAQDDEAVATEAPRWSVGAGVGFGYGPLLNAFGPSYFLGGGLGGGGPGVPAAATLPTPNLVDLTPRLSLEYRVAPDLSLLLDASGGYSRSTQDLTETDVVDRGAALALGLRNVVAARGALRVSVHGMAQAAVSHSEWLSYVFDAERMEYVERKLTQDALTAGLTGGLAVERDLLDGLSVRLGADLFGVSYGKAEVKDPSSDLSREASRLRAVVTFHPTLELRLAF